MNWLNIETATLDSPEFVGSDPIARGVWLCLLRYCAGQENSGRITACASWPDRKWQQLCRVTKAEIEAQSALWFWDAEDLLVWSYPIDKESEVKARRASGIKGGKAKTQAKTQAAQSNGAKHNPSTNPSKHPSKTQAKTQRKEKEKEKENENTMIAPDGAAFALESPPDDQNSDTKAPRPRKPVLDSLATVGGGKPEEVTQWGPAIKAMADISAVTPNLTAEEVRKRAANYRTHFDGAALTPTALAKHWSVCAEPKIDSKGKVGLDQIARERAEAGGKFHWQREGGF